MQTQGPESETWNPHLNKNKNKTRAGWWHNLIRALRRQSALRLACSVEQASGQLVLHRETRLQNKPNKQNKGRVEGRKSQTRHGEVNFCNPLARKGSQADFWDLLVTWYSCGRIRSSRLVRYPVSLTRLRASEMVVQWLKVRCPG